MPALAPNGAGSSVARPPVSTYSSTRFARAAPTASAYHMIMGKSRHSKIPTEVTMSLAGHNNRNQTLLQRSTVSAYVTGTNSSALDAHAVSVVTPAHFGARPNLFSSVRFGRPPMRTKVVMSVAAMTPPPPEEPNKKKKDFVAQSNQWKGAERISSNGGRSASKSIKM